MNEVTLLINTHNDQDLDQVFCPLKTDFVILNKSVINYLPLTLDLWQVQHKKLIKTFLVNSELFFG